jgi:hypothetical protein
MLHACDGRSPTLICHGDSPRYLRPPTKAKQLPSRPFDYGEPACDHLAELLSLFVSYVENVRALLASANLIETVALPSGIL